MIQPEVGKVFEHFKRMESRANADFVLQTLARQFEATSVGMGTLEESATDFLRYTSSPGPKALPWQTNGELLTIIRTSLAAVAHRDETGEWLIAAVTVPPGEESMAAWVHRPHNAWTESERWQWAFAGQALARWCFDGAAKSALLASRQNRLELSAVIARRLVHEFGNFLTGIMGFTELAQARAASDNTLATYLQEVMLSANQGADWIRRLHRFCQRTTTPIWPTHLASLLLANDTRDQALGLKQRWLIDVPAELPLLQIDAGSLQAIFQELQNNAREATKEHGTLTVRARVLEMSAADGQNMLGSLVPGTCVEITVADDGPGFSAEPRARLFRDVFYSSKPRHRGTGLLVVYGTLQRFHGGLAVDLDTQESGAIVRFYLPIATLPTSTPTGKPPHVMLVHSDPVLLESMRTVLSAAGMRVSTVNAANTAISTFQLAKPPISLVVTEMIMAGVSGFELARRILDHHPKAQFLFLNAQTAFFDFAKEDLQKRFTVLRWPTDIAGFLKAVEDALAPPA